MSITRGTAPITETDEALRKALEDAHLPSLLPALAQTTGDLSLLRDDLVPDTTFLAGDQGGFSPEQQETARRLALDALIAFRDGGCRESPAPSPETLRKILDYMTGSPTTNEYLPLLIEELALAGEDDRASHWSRQSVDPDRPFQVAIIGAGMSGILAAIRLQEANVPYVLLEKNADVGGTWFENSYPGCRVDVSNHYYSYSFAQKTDWPHFFSTRGVLLDYFRQCADEYDIRPHIRFRTEVVSARWNDERCVWRLELRTPDGGEESLEVQAMISAVGQLNRPKMPDIFGMESFSGPSFHSARWDHEVELAGRRVAVIGTGASAAQFIPIVADDVQELKIFQRTAPWLIPTPNYHDEVPEGLRLLFGRVPHYAQWYRFWLFWTTAEGLLQMVEVDPDWQPQDRAVSAANDQLRALMVEYLREQVGDDPELFEKVVPNYPPASKRILRDNGIWGTTLKRDHVHLITNGIDKITPRGVLTKGGEEHAVDVIIYGTGFQASRFLTPIKVYGRNGCDLHQQWDGNARAYMGITIPNFPNFFCLYGPNTNIVVNGSIIYFSECEVQYILGCLRLLLQEGHRAMDCRKDVHDAYNIRIDEGNLKMAWGVSKVPSWYKNAKGRVAQNWPFSLLEFWQQTKTPDPSDYQFL